MRFHNGNCPLYEMSSSSEKSSSTSPSIANVHIRTSPIAQFISHRPATYCHVQNTTALTNDYITNTWEKELEIE